MTRAERAALLSWGARRWRTAEQTPRPAGDDALKTMDVLASVFQKWKTDHPDRT
jgi:hypothetical protein